MIDRMIRIGIFIIIGVIPAVLASCGKGGGGGGTAAWTVLVYMAADNNLSDNAPGDIAEMEAVGSKNGVKVVVQIDRSNETAKRLLVKKGSTVQLDDLGEIDMADPETLKDFIQWGVKRYPADRTALILWSHGDGYKKPGVARNARELPDSILQDGPKCCLSNVLVRQAMEDAGTHFDLLGFDASKMGQVETADEFSGVSDLLVFSEESGPLDGWDYSAVLDGLTAKPEMDPEDLSRLIVESFGNYYETVFYPANPLFTPDQQTYNISAVRLGDTLHALVAKIDDLSVLLKDALDSPATGDDTLDAVASARDAAQGMVNLTFCPDYVDWFDFLDQLISEPNLTSDVLDSATEAAALKDSTVIAEYHGQARPGAKGLSILFYDSVDKNCTNYDPAYLDGTSAVAFVADTHWDEFLTDYYTEQGSLP